MPQYRAAILSGPRGPFAVVEMTEAQRRQLSPDDRQAVGGCVRQKHGTAMPVVFVVASPSTMNAIDGQDVTDDVSQCLAAHRAEATRWWSFDHPGDDDASARPVA